MIAKLLIGCECGTSIIRSLEKNNLTWETFSKCRGWSWTCGKGGGPSYSWRSAKGGQFFVTLRVEQNNFFCVCAGTSTERHSLLLYLCSLSEKFVRCEPHSFMTASMAPSVFQLNMYRQVFRPLENHVINCHAPWLWGLGNLLVPI